MSKQTKNKLVPKLRFLEFQDAGEWDEKSLVQICEVNPPAKKLPKSFVYIDLESVEAGVLLKKKFIQLEGAPSRAQRLLKKGDVIFQMVRPYQKNNYFFQPEDDSDYVASTGYAQLRAHQSNMYLFQYLHNERFVDRVLAKCTGSNYPAINSSDLSEIKLEIPDPKEQQKIADCLSSIDEVTTAQTQKVDALKAHKKGLMQQLFPAEDEIVPRLRFPEFQDAGEWVEKNFYDLLEDVLDFRGRTPKKLGMDWGGGNIVSLSANNVKNGFIDFDAECNLGSKGLYEKWMGKVNLEKGDIVFTMEAPLGKALLVPDTQRYILSQRVVAFKTKKEVNNAFLIQLIWSGLFQNKMMMLSTGSTAKGINQKTLKKVNVIIPIDEKEQQKIADCLSYIDELITAQTQKVDALKAHKKGLMQQLFPSVVEVNG